MRRSRRPVTGVVLGTALLLTACARATAPADVEVAEGWTVEVVREDLAGPTQVALDGDGRLLLAELAGGEDAGAGRVVRLGATGAGDPEVLADGLLTPTGVGVVGPAATLAVQEQRRLVLVTDDGVTVVTEGLPFNGRSQGSLGTVLTADGDGVVATVTGEGSGPDRGASGRLDVVRLVDGVPEPTTIAVGFKNGYAQAVDPRTGDLYVTEIGDGRYDGEVPPDELHVIPAGVWEGAVYDGGAPFDGGWPRCTGDGDPTEAFGATAEECAALPRPLALFAPRSTPTGVAVTDAGRVLVALWVEGRVVEVDPTTGEVTDVLTGVGNPQHLLAMPDGTVLLTVHDRGALWRLTPPS